jgi:hypothetical protein
MLTPARGSGRGPLHPAMSSRRVSRFLVHALVVALLTLSTLGSAHAYIHADEAGHRASCATCRIAKSTPLTLSEPPTLFFLQEWSAASAIPAPRAPRTDAVLVPAPRGPPAAIR